MSYNTTINYPLWLYCLVSELSSSGRKGSYLSQRLGWGIGHSKRVAREFGYDLPRENGMNEDEKKKLIEYWKLGLSDGSIAKRLYIGKRTAAEWRRKCGLKPNYTSDGRGAREAIIALRNMLQGI